MSVSNGDPLTAGAARAAGERAKRTRTPLVAAPDPAPDAPATDPAVENDDAKAAASEPGSGAGNRAAAGGSGRRPSRPHRPRPRGDTVPGTAAVDAADRRRRPRRGPVRPEGASKPGKTTSDPGGRPQSGRSRRVAGSERDTGWSPETRRSGVVDLTSTPVVPGRRDERADPLPEAALARQQAAAPGPGQIPPRQSGEAFVDDFAEALSRSELRPHLEDLIAAGVAGLRTVAAASGLGQEQVEVHVARALSFLRRRLTGDYDVDEFGFDVDYVENVWVPLLRPLFRTWFRVEVRGAENIPTEGAALIVANHSGTLPLDAMMTAVAVHESAQTPRYLRLLAADFLFRHPLLASVSRKGGTTLAASDDAERLLARGELVGVFPEGFKGVGKPFSERYKLQRFGRGGFVSAAIRNGCPIVPCSIVGAEETYPMLGNLKAVARLLGWPYFPVTPTFPLLGLFGLVPLPSKWIIEFGTPIPTSHFGDAVADDPMMVFDLTDQVRETIQQTLYSLLMIRRAVFS